MQHSRLSEKILFSALGEAESLHETEESRDQEGPPAMCSQVPGAPNLRCIKASQAQPWKKAKFRHLSGRWWWTPAFPSSTVPGFLIQSVGRQSVCAPQGETSLWVCPLTAEQTQVLCESPGPHSPTDTYTVPMVVGLSPALYALVQLAQELCCRAEESPMVCFLTSIHLLLKGKRPLMTKSCSHHIKDFWDYSVYYYPCMHLSIKVS